MEFVCHADLGCYPEITNFQHTPVPISFKKVKLANGQILVSAAMAPDMEWWCQGHTFRTDLQVLELGAYDAIWGMIG